MMDFFEVAIQLVRMLTSVVILLAAVLFLGILWKHRK